MHPIQALRQRVNRRIAAWARRRQGEDRVPLALAQRRLYILPTRAGIGFGVMLFFMLLAGLNYSNGLALFLTFVLGGLALVAMHQCHRNLLDVRVTSAAGSSAFAGEHARVELGLANAGSLERLALQASVGDHRGELVDLPPHGGGLASVSIPVPTRGRIRIERVRLATAFPFGLFEAWTWLHLPIELIVYPTARGARLPPEQPGARSGKRIIHGPGDDEWSGQRAFREGDSPRQVDWKAYARGAPLVVKEYTSAGADERRFDYGNLAGLGPEPRLEQLSRWVVDADARGDRYALMLPGLHVAAAQGLAHRERCLRALALFGDPAGAGH